MDRVRVGVASARFSMDLSFPPPSAIMPPLCPPLGRPDAHNSTRVPMPRPTKAFKRQKINAAAAWKKGDRKEAYVLWAKATKGMQEHLAKKKNKKKPAAD